jgi:hypothetical protein
MRSRISALVLKFRNWTYPAMNLLRCRVPTTRITTTPLPKNTYHTRVTSTANLFSGLEGLWDLTMLNVANNKVDSLEGVKRFVKLTGEYNK